MTGGAPSENELLVRGQRIINLRRVLLVISPVRMRMRTSDKTVRIFLHNMVIAYVYQNHLHILHTY